MILLKNSSQRGGAIW